MRDSKIRSLGKGMFVLLSSLVLVLGLAAATGARAETKDASKDRDHREIVETRSEKSSDRKSDKDKSTTENKEIEGSETMEIEGAGV
jgi:hypothetical protein